jgi:phosphatidylinositol 4-kinase A
MSYFCLYFYLPLCATALQILTQLAPSIHGLYRAIISTSFPWTLDQWQKLSTHLSDLWASDTIDRLNRLLVDILQNEDSDEETARFIQIFLARYVNRGRPLSGYFIVCCVLETQWTVLAQVLAPPQQHPARYGREIVEAAAANKAWLSLMRNSALNLGEIDEKTKKTLREATDYAMHCFTDLLVQIQEMESEPSLDTYAWETMAESLVCHEGSFGSIPALMHSIETCFRLLRRSARPGSRVILQAHAFAE